MNNRLITCSSLESHFQLCLWRLLCSFDCINFGTLFLTVLGGIRYRCFSVQKGCCWRVSVLVTLPRRQGRVWAGRGRGREESQKQKRKGWAVPWGRGSHQIKSRDFVTNFSDSCSNRLFGKVHRNAHKVRKTPQSGHKCYLRSVLWTKFT